MKLDDETLSQMKHLFQEGHTIKQISDMYNLTYGKVKWAFDSRGWKSTHKQFHGGSGTRLYRIHKAMNTRCYNPNFPAYKYYGGKGIVVCDEWVDDFVAFREWSISNGYEDNLTIDRIDGNGNYEPSNCRWVTLADQQRNKDNNILINVKGESLTVTEVSKKYNIPMTTLRNRISLGTKDEDLIKPKKRDVLHTIKGEKLLLEEASIKYNIPWSTLRWRHQQGVTGDDLLKKQPRRNMKEIKVTKEGEIK